MSTTSAPSASRLWKFSVIQNEEMEGNVCISGDCDSLGNWLSNTIVPMTYNEYVNLCQLINLFSNLILFRENNFISVYFVVNTSLVNFYRIF